MLHGHEGLSKLTEIESEKGREKRNRMHSWRFRVKSCSVKLDTLLGVTESLWGIEVTNNENKACLLYIYRGDCGARLSGNGKSSPP